MKKISLVISLFLFCVVPFFSDGAKEARTALLIANSNYENIDSLKTPEKEAIELGKVLDSLGFKVTILTDANQNQMDRELDSFRSQLERNGGIGFFHYGGHAIEINGDNYLVPVDVKNTDERNVKRQSVELSFVLSSMKGNTNIIILDSCRDNPFDSSGYRGFSSKRGLSLIKDSSSPKNSIIVFSASEGQVAQEGIFTPILTKHLTDKKDFILILRDVRREVYEKTNGRQNTISSEKLISDLYLAGVPEASGSGKVVSVTDIDKKITTDYVALGKDEYNKRNFKAAYDYFLKAEQNKQKDCYYYLGLCYEKGNGVEKDYQKAFAYYQLGSKNNQIDSLMKLGDCYTDGIGTNKDLAKAFTAYKKAADLGDVTAVLKVASLYQDGIGVKQNEKAAFNYYMTAAIKGNAVGQAQVGNAYFEGKVVKKDLEKSQEYLELALKQNNSEVKKCLGYIEYKKACDYLKAGDDEKYISSLERAAEFRCKEAEYDLAVCYENGSNGLYQDRYYASELYYRSAEDGYAPALYLRGLSYYNQKSYYNYSSAIDYLEKAAAQDHAEACNLLGLCYFKGECGVNKDFGKALEYYQKAVDLGYLDVPYYNIGRVYQVGDNQIPQDYKKSFSYFQLSAKYKNPLAYIRMADYYRDGTGVKKDLKVALVNYELAAQAGNQNGLYNAAVFYFNGWGTNKNYEKAAKYFCSCLEMEEDRYDYAYRYDYYEARKCLGIIEYENAKALSEKAKTKEDLENVYEAYSKAVDYGNIEAEFHKGYMAYHGIGTMKSFYTAYWSFYESTINILSNYYLGVMYYKGEYVDRSYVKAKQYFENAAERGNVDAMNYLGYGYSRYEFGNWTVGWEKAVEWYKKAADAGSIEALTSLGDMYVSDSDYSKAYEYYQKAADSGNAKAQYEMAIALHEGKYLPINEKKALKYLNMSAAQNYEPAVYKKNNGWDSKRVEQVFYNNTAW